MIKLFKYTPKNIKKFLQSLIQRFSHRESTSLIYYMVNIFYKCRFIVNKT